MKTNNLLEYVFLFLILTIIPFCWYKSALLEEKQGRLIKPFPKDTTNKHPECNACRIAHQYSLNINLKHYGVKDSIK